MQIHLFPDDQRADHQVLQDLDQHAAKDGDDRELPVWNVDFSGTENK